MALQAQSDDFFRTAGIRRINDILTDGYLNFNHLSFKLPKTQNGQELMGGQPVEYDIYDMEPNAQNSP